MTSGLPAVGHKFDFCGLSMLKRLLLLSLCLLMTTTPQLQADDQPIVIAHRGASGYLPEHTLEAATLAYMLGADYIEQDLVLSKDRQLIVLHDIHLDTVTDVATKFPNRAREDGRYYALDFTLAELRTLRVQERRDLGGAQVYPGRYQGQAEFRLATFDEEVELINNLNRRFNKSVGLYPEIKAPAWHREQGYDISALTLDALEQHGLNRADAKVFMQCFDFAETQRLRRELGLKTPLIQLIADNSWGESTTDYQALTTASGLAEIREVADGIGPWLPQLIDRSSGNDTGLAAAAKEAGLQIHPYTFRLEELGGVSAEQLLDRVFMELQVDGIFTDYTDVVVEFLAERNLRPAD